MLEPCLVLLFRGESGSVGCMLEGLESTSACVRAGERGGLLVCEEKKFHRLYLPCSSPDVHLLY